MMLNPDPLGVVEPEDRDIVAKLAKLHDIHSQIGGLRSLLPEKLINPARLALDRGYEPETLATYLQTAAKAGSRDVERFKTDWHNDEIRELWQTVNANELPQGGDSWPLEYKGLLQNAGTHEQTTITANEPRFQPPSGPELVKLVGDFRARHPELKIRVSDEANPLPIDIQVGQLDFRVEQRHQSSGDTEYVVIGKPGTEPSSLQHDILQSISESEHRARLTTLLVRIPTFLHGTPVFTDEMVQEMIASYRDVKTRPCSVCHKLVETKGFQLPLIRQSKPTQNDQHPQFVAIHRNCK